MVEYPTYVTTRTSSDEAFNAKSPFISVIVPFEVPLITILAPGIPSPFSSVTVPVTAL